MEGWREEAQYIFKVNPKMQKCSVSHSSNYRYVTIKHLRQTIKFRHDICGKTQVLSINKLWDSQGYTEKPYLNTLKEKNNTEHLVYDILINFIVIFGVFNSIYY